MSPRSRTLTLAAVLSILLPGLGHVYIGRMWRALVWFAGLIAIGEILAQGGVGAWVKLALASALGLCAALDAGLLARAAPTKGPS